MEKEILFFNAIIRLSPNLSLLTMVTTDKLFDEKLCDVSLIRSDDDIKKNIFKIILDSDNKNELLNASTNHLISTFLESMEIEKDGNILFKGYDGMSYGLISNTISLPDDFKSNFIDDDMCEISEDLKSSYKI